MPDVLSVPTRPPLRPAVQKPAPHHGCGCFAGSQAFIVVTPYLARGHGDRRAGGRSSIGPKSSSNEVSVTPVDATRFESPVERLGVSGGTAPFFALSLAAPAAERRPTAYFIGKDLSRAEDEVVFYEEALALRKSDGQGGLGPLLSSMLEYEGVVTLPEKGVSSGADRRLLVLRNLFEGCTNIRLLDLKIGEQTAAADWQGKSRIGAIKQGVVDSLTNSVAEGYRLEGFDGEPPALRSMDALMDFSQTSHVRKKDIEKKARRVMLQQLTGLEIAMHLIDMHQEPADPGADALAAVVSPTEVAELALCEMARLLAGLAMGCRKSPVPHKWIGSSVALAFDAGRLPARDSAPEEVRAAVRVQVFDWGRSELNTPDKHAALSPEEREDRETFWRYYRGGIDRLFWSVARSYWNRFSNRVGWQFLRATVIDFDSNTANDFIGRADLPLEACDETTVPLVDAVGAPVRGSNGEPSTLTYAMEYRALPRGSRLTGCWRVHVLRASSLPSMDGLVSGSADPFVELTAFSEDVSALNRTRSSIAVHAQGEAKFTWAWGDINALAANIPMSWSTHMSATDLAEHVRSHASNGDRPISVNDDKQGRWHFENKTKALEVLADFAGGQRRCPLAGHHHPHVSFQQQTSIKAVTLDPEWNEVLELPVAAAAGVLEAALETSAPGLGTSNLQALLPQHHKEGDPRMESAFRAWTARLDEVAAA